MIWYIKQYWNSMITCIVQTLSLVFKVEEMSIWYCCGLQSMYSTVDHKYVKFQNPQVKDYFSIK